MPSSSRSIDRGLAKQGGKLASKRQIEPIGQTQRKSTGPQTSAGKAASSRNAYRHGLSRWDEAAGSASARFDTALAEELSGLSMEVALQDLAQARKRQDRLRALRLHLIMAVIEGADRRQIRELSGLERYEKAAVSRQRRGLKRVRACNG